MAEVLGFSYFAPLLAFLIVFVVIFATLNRTKMMGENAWLQLFVSFLIATVFVSAAGARDYVLTITPWFAVLVVSLFFLLFIIGFVGKPAEWMTKGVGIGFIVLALVMFLVSGFVVFSEVLIPLFFGGSGDPEYVFLRTEILNSRLFGGILLVGVSALVSWVLVRSAGKK